MDTEKARQAGGVILAALLIGCGAATEPCSSGYETRWYAEGSGYATVCRAFYGQVNRTRPDGWVCVTRPQLAAGDAAPTPIDQPDLFTEAQVCKTEPL